jgi:hypothetical protein
MSTSEPEVNAQAPGTHPARGRVIFDTWFGKWIIQRGTAFLVWFWFLLRFLGRPLPLIPFYPREVLLVPSALAIILMILSARWFRIMFYPFYVFFFPVIPIWLLGAGIVRVVRLPLRAGRLALSGRAVIILCLIVIVAWPISIGVDTPPAAAAILSFVAHSATFFLVLQLFRWASSPYGPLTAPLEFFAAKVTPFMKKSFIDPGFENEGQPRQSATLYCEWILKAIDKLQPPGPLLESGLTAFAYTKLVPIAIGSFLSAFLAMAISFAALFRSLENAWPHQLQGLTASNSFGDFLYFTILCEATSPPNEIIPLTPLARLITIWNVLAGVLLLTLLLALFTTSMGLHGETPLAKIAAILKGEKAKYSEWLTSLKELSGTSGQVIDATFKTLPPSTDDG